MNKVKSIVLVFAFSFVNGQYDLEGVSKDDYFNGYNDTVVEDEVYKKNMSENGIEDVYSENYGGLLNLFGRDSIGVVDDEDPDIGVVDDPDDPPAPINTYQFVLFAIGLSYIIYKKYRNTEIT